MVFSLATFAQEAAVPEVTTMEELKANAGQTVIYKGLELSYSEQEIEDPLSPWPIIQKTFMMPDNETIFEFSMAAQLMPAKVDALGVYDAANKTFTVDAIEQYYSFFTWNGLNMYMTYFGQSLTTEPLFMVKEAVPVTYVSGRGNLLAVEVQLDLSGMGQTMPAGLQIACNPMYFRNGYPAIGDVFCDIEGIFTCINHETQTPMSLQIVSHKTSDKDIKAAYGQYTAEDLANFKSEYNSYFYNATAVALNPTEGKIVAKTIVEGEGDDVFSYDEYYYSDGTDSILLTTMGKYAQDIDLSQYVDKDLEFAPQGVYFHETQSIEITHCGYVDNSIYFENIAALKANGTTASACALKNPVMVNLVYETRESSYLFIEDKTGTLLIQADLQELDIESGDSIVGVKGNYYHDNKLTVSAEFGFPVLAAEKVSDGIYNIEENITLGDINNDFKGEQNYNLRVVRLANLEAKIIDPDDSENWYYLIQGKDTIEINKFYWLNSGLTEMPSKIETLVCVVDYMAVTNGTQGVTVQPLNAESVVVKGETPTNVENVEVANIYTENGLIVADGEFEIFTVTGQNVTNLNGNLQGGVYVVRTANATAKVVVK